MKIIFSGGGTLGPVTPLIALYQTIEAANYHVEPLWVGTKKGPERELIEANNIPFTTIAAGKYRRYSSWRNITDLVYITIGFFQSLKLLWKEQPAFCMSAGGYNSVPLHWAAWLLGIPTWVHQQDVQIGLANKLMAPVATVVTTSLKQLTDEFPANKVQWLGNPVRQDVYEGTAAEARKRFGIPEGMPVLFATGGGTGSLRVNQLVVEALPHLQEKIYVLHLSGRERPQRLVNEAAKHVKHYSVHEFFTDEMKDAYAVADVVISRGGFGTMTEIAALKKPVILIPKPGQQEQNVSYLAKAGAAIMVNEQLSDGYALAKQIQALFADKKEQASMGEKLYDLLPPARRETIVKAVKRCLKDV